MSGGWVFLPNGRSHTHILNVSERQIAITLPSVVPELRMLYTEKPGT